MPTTDRNRAWGLDAFLESLVRDLDDWQETLAVKGLTRPLTYTVQDVALDLQCFPQFDEGDVRFVTASPGESGASSLRFQLGSISAASIRDTTPDPVSRDDTVIAALDAVPAKAKQALTKAGIKTARDLERVAQRNVDIKSVTGGEVSDYSDLANIINKSRRATMAPTVQSVVMDTTAGGPRLHVRGENLSLGKPAPDFPSAALGGRRVKVVESAPDHVVVAIDAPPTEPVRLDLALDPFAVVSMELQP